VVDPASFFPGTRNPSDVAPATAPRDVASASAGAVALADAPEPTAAASASEPLGGPAPVAAGAGGPVTDVATLPATR
jgi:hypothetical protein